MVKNARVQLGSGLNFLTECPLNDVLKLLCWRVVL
jgi:hypothetical protein